MRPVLRLSTAPLAGIALLAAIVPSASLGCSDRDGSTTQIVSRASQPAARTAALLRTLRASPWLSLSPARARPLHATGERVRLGDAGRGFVAGLRPAGEVRLALDDDDGFWLELIPVVASAPAPTAVDGALVYEAVAPGTDLVQVASTEAFEELRVLRDASAPRASSWRLRVGPSVAATRAREGRVELLDREGVVRLGSAPVVAVDAEGRRIEGDLELAGDRLVVRVGDATAAYPLVVDPLWTTTATMKVPRRNAALVPFGAGKALAIGGNDPGGTALSSVELYTASTNTWALQASMKTARISPFAAPVAAGAKVVVASASASELFDGSTWTTLTGPSGAPTAIAGHSLGALVHMNTTAATFEASTSKWFATAVPTTRGVPSLVTLSDGRVLATGGSNPSGNPGDPIWIGATEIFDPSTRAFTTKATGENLADSTWVVVGTTVWGFGGMSASMGAPMASYSTGIRKYDVGTNAWTHLAEMLNTRASAIGFAMPSGTIMILGGTNGYDVTSSKTFTPSTTAVGSGGASPTGLLPGAWAPLSAGTLLVLDWTQSGGAVPRLFGLYALGGACTHGYECSSGSCVDGVCCGAKSCATGARCDLPTTKGSCAKPLGIACAAGTECETGFCVDGVCCSTSCTAGCAACDAPGLVGTCSPIAGAPHGTRAACAGAGSTNPCARQLCNGVDTAACHYAPKGTVLCGTNACASGVETHVATCDGAGACGDVPRNCGLYVCGATSCPPVARATPTAPPATTATRPKARACRSKGSAISARRARRARRR